MIDKFNISFWKNLIINMTVTGLLRDTDSINVQESPRHLSVFGKNLRPDQLNFLMFRYLDMKPGPIN